MSLVGLFLLMIYIERKRPAAAFLLTIILVVGYSVSDSLVDMWSRLGSDSFEEASSFDLTEAAFYLQTIFQNLYVSLNLLHLLMSLVLIAAAVHAFRWVLARLAAYSKLDAVLLLSGLVLLGTGVSVMARTAYVQFEAARDSFGSVSANFSSLSVPSLRRSEKGPLSLLVYVGESTSAMNMQLYGYPRRTTPLLARFASEDEGLIAFDRVFSTHTHTSPSLLEAFSLRPSTQNSHYPIDEQRRISLVSMFANSGIRVALYSNQGKSGTWNYASSIVFKNAERHFSVNAAIGNNEPGDRPFDREFLTSALADRAFSDGESSLVLFHSYAGHGPYLRNIPATLPAPEWLSPAAARSAASNPFKVIVDQYDTAVSYVDGNVEQALRFLRTLRKPWVFVYFSDHGESPSTGLGHDSSRFRVEMARVPFVVYFNEAARREYPERFQQMLNLSQNRNIATLDQLPSTLLYLMGLSFDDRAGLEVPPLVGEDWSPDPILVRRTSPFISYIQFSARQHPAREVRSSLPDAVGSSERDAMSTCFNPQRVPGHPPDGLDLVDCVSLQVHRMKTPQLQNAELQ